MSILDFLRKEKDSLSNVLSIFALNSEPGSSNLKGAEQDFLDTLSLGLSPADLAGLSDNELDGLFDLGLQFAQDKDFEQAEAVLTKLIQFEPLHDRAYYALGVVAQARGETKTAINHYMMFLALNATNAQGYLRLGECLSLTGEDGDARAALKMAIAIDENEPFSSSIATYARTLLQRIGTD